MIKLLYTTTAKQDLHDIKSYITHNLLNNSAAKSVVENITKKAGMLTEHPGMGASLQSILDIETDYRFLVCNNYTVFYRQENDVVRVIRILYGRRDFMKILFGVTEDRITEER